MNKIITILIWTVITFSCSLLPHYERGYLTIYNPNDFDVYYDLKISFYSGTNSDYENEDNDFSGNFKILKPDASKQYYASVYTSNNHYYTYEFRYYKDTPLNMHEISANIHFNSDIRLDLTF